MTTTPAQRKAKLASIEAAIKGGLTVAEAAKKAGIHQVTYYAWRKAANGNGTPTRSFKMKPGQRDTARTFQQLEAENARLRAILGELLVAGVLQSHPTI